MLEKKNWINVISKTDVDGKPLMFINIVTHYFNTTFPINKIIMSNIQATFNSIFSLLQSHSKNKYRYNCILNNKETFQIDNKGAKCFNFKMHFSQNFS